MNAFRLAFAEFLGLFVDDGMLAVFTLLLIAAATLLVEYAGLAPLAGGALLFFGAVAILAESTHRGARPFIGRNRPSGH